MSQKQLCVQQFTDIMKLSCCRETACRNVSHHATVSGR